MSLSKDEIVAIVRREIDQAQGYDADVLATKRENALNYYHGKMDAAPDGRSQLVSKDVADTVHSLLSTVGRIFQTSMLQFEAESEDDEQAANMESDFVRKQLERSGGWTILNDAAHDALLIGNGFIKVSIDEEKDTVTRTFPPLDRFQIDSIYQQADQNQEIIIKEDDDKTTVKTTTTNRKLKIEAISPDVMLFNNSGGQYDLDETRFVAERILYTGNDLRKMGIAQIAIDNIPYAPEDYWPAVRAREGIYQDTQEDSEAPQEAERLRECFDCYIRLDDNEDGTTELRNILMGGNEILQDERASCIPYATGSPCPMPHRIQGTGMFELIGGVQESKTSILRKYVDNLEVMNSSRLGIVDGDVNTNDLTNGRINGVVRMKHPQAIVPLPATDAGQQAIQGLNYLDQVRSQRGAQSVDMNDSDRQIMASSAAGASGIMESSERMAGWYARNLTNTLLKDTYQLIHKRMRLEMPGEIQVNLRGKWTKTDPAQWRERTMDIVSGMTTTERSQRIAGLNVTITSLKSMMDQGGEGIITNKEKLYNAMGEWIRASELGEPEDYLIDPSSEESQQAQQQQAQAQQQQQEQMMQMQQQQAALMKEIEDQKVQFDYYKTDQELKFKYFDSRLDAEIKEAEITVDTVTKLNDNNARARDSAESTGQGNAKDAA